MADGLMRIAQSGSSATVVAHPGADGKVSIRVAGNESVDRQVAAATLGNLAAAHGYAALAYAQNRSRDFQGKGQMVVEAALPAGKIRFVVFFRDVKNSAGFGIGSLQFATQPESAPEIQPTSEDFFRGFEACPGGRDFWHHHHLTAEGEKTVDAVDLGDLAVSLFVRSIGYFLLAAAVGTVLIILLSIFGPKQFARVSGWPIIWTIWVGLQIKNFLWLWRLAKGAPPYRATSHTIHKLEFCSAAFLVLYALARPYLADSDASAYPYVKGLLQFVAGSIALFHLAVLGIFRRRPSLLDVGSLGAAIGAALTSLLK